MKTLWMCILILALAAGTVLAADVTGAWKATMTGRQGQTFETTFTFKVDGEKLTGSVSNPRGGGQTEISDGKVSGDTISFKVTREFGGNSMVFKYEGTVSGDEIKFKQTMEGGDRPPREFTAKKVS